MLPALQAGAMGEGRNLLTTALSRPLIARKLVEIAHMEGARAIAHGERRPGTGPTPIELSLRALDPAITVIALAQAWGLSQLSSSGTRKSAAFRSRRRTSNDRRQHVGPVDSVRARRRFVAGVARGHVLSTHRPRSPDAPAYVELEFERGVPVTLNGIAMSLVELI